jgi:VanZ family protein
LGARLQLFRVTDFLLYWLPPLVWTGSILTLSGDLGSSRNTLSLLKGLLSWLPFLTPAGIEVINGYLRKAGHALAYGSLYFLWFRAFRGQGHYGRGRAFLWSLSLCLLLAIADEGHQSFLASRSGSLKDVALDLLGAGLGALLTLAFWHPGTEATRPSR